MNVRYALTRRAVGGGAVLLTAVLAVAAGVQLLDTGLSEALGTLLAALVVVVAAVAVVLAVGRERGGGGRTPYW